jgi:hypothetical protein
MKHYPGATRKSTTTGSISATATSTTTALASVSKIRSHKTPAMARESQNNDRSAITDERFNDAGIGIGDKNTPCSAIDISQHF